MRWHGPLIATLLLVGCGSEVEGTPTCDTQPGVTNLGEWTGDEPRFEGRWEVTALEYVDSHNRPVLALDDVTLTGITAWADLDYLGFDAGPDQTVALFPSLERRDTGCRSDWQRPCDDDLMHCRDVAGRSLPFEERQFAKIDWTQSLALPPLFTPSMLEDRGYKPTVTLHDETTFTLRDDGVSVELGAVLSLTDEACEAQTPDYDPTLGCTVIVRYRLTLTREAD
ncbi:MAG: hypothetical protein R3B72_12210 [Polyangiaceae bacterium]